jgi:hypothetical protein
MDGPSEPQQGGDGGHLGNRPLYSGQIPIRRNIHPARGGACLCCNCQQFEPRKIERAQMRTIIFDGSKDDLEKEYSKIAARFYKDMGRDYIDKYDIEAAAEKSIEAFSRHLKKQVDESLRAAVSEGIADAIAFKYDSSFIHFEWDGENPVITWTFDDNCPVLEFDFIECAHVRMDMNRRPSDEEFANLDKAIKALQELRANWDAIE